MADDFISLITLPNGLIYDIQDADAARSSHSHGNISNAGAIATSTSSTITTNDALVISTTANSGKLTRSTIVFNTANTTKILSLAGTWIDFVDTKNTAGSTNTASKIFLVGATSLTANAQTYSNTYIHATDGLLSADSFAINDSSSTNYVTLQWNATDESLDFVFT